MSKNKNHPAWVSSVNTITYFHKKVSLDKTRERESTLKVNFSCSPNFFTMSVFIKTPGGGTTILDLSEPTTVINHVYPPAPKFGPSSPFPTNHPCKHDPTAPFPVGDKMVDPRNRPKKP